MTIPNTTVAFSGGSVLFNGTTVAFGEDCCCESSPSSSLLIRCSTEPVAGGFCPDIVPGFNICCPPFAAGDARFVHSSERGNIFRFSDVCFFSPPEIPTCDAVNANFGGTTPGVQVYNDCAACECECLENGEKPSSLTVTFAGIMAATCCPQGAQSRQFRFTSGAGYDGTWVLYPGTAGYAGEVKCDYVGTTSIAVTQTLHSGTACGGAALETNNLEMSIRVTWVGAGAEITFSGSALGAILAPRPDVFHAYVAFAGTTCNESAYADNDWSSCQVGGAGLPAFAGSVSVVPNF